MEIDDSDFQKGGDWIMYRGEFYKKPVSIAVNVCNGWFFVYHMNGDLLASHLSTELDNEEWYANLLNVIYEE